MLTFLIVMFLIYGTMHFYALGKIWKAFQHSIGLGFMLALWGLAMTLSPLILWLLNVKNMHAASSIFSWVIYIWMALLFLFCCTAILFDLFHRIVSLAGFKWPLSNTMALSAITLLTFCLFGYGFFSARQIQVEKLNITTHKLSPAIGKISIAQISDLHLGAMLGDEFLQRVINKLQELKPDIVVATGDVIDGQGDDLNSLAQRFLALHPRKGLFSVTGNHEYFAGLDQSLNFLRNAGFTVLRGEAVATGGIVLAGIDDHTTQALGQEIKLETKQALATVSKNDFIILLKHQPVVDTETPFDLQLSGHIHGGQIFPFGLFTWLEYHVQTGLTPLPDGRRLYVSRGTGTWGPPIRLFAAPEITLITLVSVPE